VELHRHVVPLRPRQRRPPPKLLTADSSEGLAQPLRPPGWLVALAGGPVAKAEGRPAGGDLPMEPTDVGLELPEQLDPSLHEARALERQLIVERVEHPVIRPPLPERRRLLVEAALEGPDDVEVGGRG